MSLANDIHREPEQEGKNSIGTDRMPKVNKKKSKVFSFCGLSCVHVKSKKTEFDASFDSFPPQLSANNAKLGSCAARVGPPQHPQKVVEPPSSLRQGTPISTPRPIVTEATDTDTIESQTSSTPSSPGKLNSLFGNQTPQNPTPVITDEIEKSKALTYSTEAIVNTHRTKADSPMTALLESAGLEQKNPGTNEDSPVLNTSNSALVTAAPIGLNEVTKADTSNPISPVASTINQPTQLLRASGLMSPKVVVNKPGINMYKGRNTSSPSPLKEQSEGNLRNVNPTATQEPIPPPVVSGKLSNIHPHIVTTEVIATHTSSSIPKPSSSATRNGHASPSKISPHAAPNRSAFTGIRMPSRLSHQTPAKQ